MAGSEHIWIAEVHSTQQSLEKKDIAAGDGSARCTSGGNLFLSFTTSWLILLVL